MLNLYKQRKLEELTSKWGLSQLSVIAMPSCSDNICNSICSPWAKALLPCEASADRLRKSCTMSSGCSSSPLISPLNSRGELEDWTAEFCRLHSGGWGRKGKLLSSLHGSDPVEDEEQRLAQNADERENRGSGCSGNDTWDRGIPGSRSETDLFGDKGRPSRKLDDLISSFRMEEGLVEDKSSSDGFSQSNWRSKWTDNGEAWQECMAPSGELCCLIVIKLWLLIVLDWLKNTDREILLASNLAGKLNWWFGIIILWQTKQIPTKTKWFPLFFKENKKLLQRLTDHIFVEIWVQQPHMKNSQMEKKTAAVLILLLNANQAKDGFFMVFSEPYFLLVSGCRRYRRPPPHFLAISSASKLWGLRLWSDVFYIYIFLFIHLTSLLIPVVYQPWKWNSEISMAAVLKPQR